MFEPPSGEDDLAAQTADLDRPFIIDQDGRSIDWPYDTVTVSGQLFEVKRPQPAALQAFSMAISKHSPRGLQNDMISMFVQRHTSPASFEILLERMMDPDDTGFSAKTLGDLMRAIATLGTARPTVPSRISHSRRRTIGERFGLGSSSRELPTR